MNIPQSKRFAFEKGEDVTQGAWSEFEGIVVVQILLMFPEQDVTKLYNDVVLFRNKSNQFYQKSSTSPAIKAATFCWFPIAMYHVYIYSFFQL